MLIYILISICVLLFVYLRKANNYWKERNIKQVTGTLWQFIFGKTALPVMYKNIYDENENESAVGMYFGVQPFLLLKDLDDIQAVLASDFQSFRHRGFVASEDDILSHNLLLLSDYNKWKIIRQKLTPLFTIAKLKNMFYIMDKCARDFVNRLEEDVEFRNRSINALQGYTTSSLGAAVFGIDTKLKNRIDSPFTEMVQKSIMPTPWINLLFTIMTYIPKLIQWLNLKLFAEHEDFFVGFVKRVLECRRKDLNKRHDFIDMALELQKQGTMHDPATNYALEPTDEMIAAQAFLFFLAGVETSSNTLHFILLELSSNPKILAKVHEEIDQIFENVNEEIKYCDIEKLHYLDMVISEALRKYPTIGSISRVCNKTTVLPASNVKIEKGVGVTISILGIHRDEKYFPNPDVFDPERFSAENIAKATKSSYLPFGDGGRICLGARFARLQLKAALAWMLRTFTLEEQIYNPKSFDKSFLTVRDFNAKFKLIFRNVRQ